MSHALGLDLDLELGQLHKPLMRFAQLRLRNESLAEDLVSDTLLALLEKPEGFRGLSSLRTYATSILKHKMIDQLRRREREVQVEPLDAQDNEDAWQPTAIQDDAAAWLQPERSMEHRQLLEALQCCVDCLPPRMGRVFLMREWQGCDVSSICAELDITANHCNVMLYRARMQLRDCLQKNGLVQP
jgi:RNA polymerase sigma-70 factor (ECF subfamily)